MATLSYPTALNPPVFIRVAPATPAYSGVVFRSPVRSQRNYFIAGDYAGRIQGVTKEQATPTSPKVPVFRRVRLYRDFDGMLVREQWSDPVTGAFDFQLVDTAFTYTALAYDYTGSYQGVVATGIATEPMP